MNKAKDMLISIALGVPLALMFIAFLNWNQKRTCPQCQPPGKIEQLLDAAMKGEKE